VERSGTPGTTGFIAQAREAGDSHWPNLNDDEKVNEGKAAAALRGLDVWLLHIPGVPRFRAPP
jgi:hypothetical protein